MVAAIWRGLNTELAPTQTPSGTATAMRNVVVNGKTLAGRPGFAEYDATKTTSILNITTCEFNDGAKYIVVKRSDGFLYHRQLLPTDAGAWTKIVDLWGGHNTSDAGTFYFHNNRLHYGDRVGWTRWYPVTGGSAWSGATTYAKFAVCTHGTDVDGNAIHYMSLFASNLNHEPDDLTATRGALYWTKGVWKDGIHSSTGCVIAAAVGGEKEGYYHAVCSKYNSETEEESQVTTPQTPGIQTLVSAGNGGLTVTNSAAICVADLSYEWDSVKTYCSKGNDELSFNAESYSYRYYVDTQTLRTQSADIGLNKADDVYGPDTVFTNAGGLPPACRHACFDGWQAVYADIYSSLASVPGQISFSRPRFPTMVPVPVTYAVGGDSTTVYPKPWTGILNQPVDGKITGIGSVGGNYIAFTSTTAFWLRRQGDGRLLVTPSRLAGGCLSETGAVVTARGVYAIGKDCFVAAAPNGAANIGRYAITPTLQEIPAAYADQAVGAAFGARDEVWMAVSRGLPYSSDYAKVISTGGTANLSVSSGLANTAENWQLLPNAGSIAASDAAYFGWTAKTGTLTTITAREPTYTGAPWTAEYSKGGSAWGTLAILADTTNPDTQDGTLPFLDDGTITFTQPTDWAVDTVGGQSAYWIRFRIASTADAAKVTLPPLFRNPNATRILIYDEARKAFMGTFDPRILRGASIKSMCELSSASHSPRMLLGLSDGRILYWPSAAWKDVDAIGTFAYPTYWRGHFGQENRGRDMRVDQVLVHSGDTAAAAALTISLAGMRTGTQTDVTASSYSLSRANHVLKCGVQFGPHMFGSIYQMTLQTTVSGSAEWEIHDLFTEFGMERKESN